MIRTILTLGVLAIGVTSVMAQNDPIAARKDMIALCSGGCMVFAFAAFAGQLRAGPLQPGEFLHIGLALALLFLGVWVTSQQRRSNPATEAETGTFA